MVKRTGSSLQFNCWHSTNNPVNLHGSGPVQKYCFLDPFAVSVSESNVTSSAHISYNFDCQLVQIHFRHRNHWYSLLWYPQTVPINQGTNMIIVDDYQTWSIYQDFQLLLINNYSISTIVVDQTISTTVVDQLMTFQLLLNWSTYSISTYFNYCQTFDFHFLITTTIDSSCAEAGPSSRIATRREILGLAGLGAAMQAKPMAPPVLVGRWVGWLVGYRLEAWPSHVGMTKPTVERHGSVWCCVQS